MKPPPFEYADPRSAADAVALLADLGPDAKILAGGQSLVPLLNFRLARPRFLVDVNRVSELAYIRKLDGGLEIGAITRQHAAERSDLVRERCPLLHEALGYIGHRQIRQRGTIGGSLAHADPAAELPAVVTALDGRLRVRGRSGERALAPGEFFQGYLTTALEPDEMLAAVEFPGWAASGGSCFTEVSHRAGDFAIVGAAGALVLDGSGRVDRVGLALAGVGGVPFDASPIAREVLMGERPDHARLDELGRRVSAAVEPESDIHAPADYRRHLAGVLGRRALETALTRAEGGSA